MITPRSSIKDPPGENGMASDLPIYLDYNATTPTAESVVEAMLPWFTRTFGNASSTHAHGRLAAAAVEDGRQAVAERMGVPASGIVFTSGATEANNLAIRGVPGRVLAPATEHKAVLDTAKVRDHTIVPVDERGRVDLDALERAARGAALISVMFANNETGVVHDLEAVVDVGRRAGCLVHTDATQAFGKLDTDFGALGVDLVSVSSHKVYGPKGVGALYVRRGVQLESVMTGGGHERGIRSGTSNVPAIVGFGAATRLMRPAEQAVRSRQMLEHLLAAIADAQPFSIFSDHHSGLPNTLSIQFHGADAEAVIANAPEVCISTGSACTAAVPEPSHVLIAMGLSSERAFETLRVTVGEPTTVEEIDTAALALTRAVARVRDLKRREFTEEAT